MLALDTVLDLLLDGQWHTIGPLMKRAAVKDHAVSPVLSLLKDQGFVEVDGDKMRIPKPMLSLLRSLT